MESPPQRHFCVVLGRENSSDGLAYYSFCVDRKKCGELGEFGCCKGGNGAQLITTTPKSANVFEPPNTDFILTLQNILSTEKLESSDKNRPTIDFYTVGCGSGWAAHVSGSHALCLGLLEDS